MKARSTLPIVALALVGCNAADAASESTPTTTTIERAVRVCTDPNIRYADDGQTLIIDGLGEFESGVVDHADARSCVFSRLKVTEAIQTRIGNTRALDGTQEASWSDYEASWTYHPDDGLDMTITVSTP